MDLRQTGHMALTTDTDRECHMASQEPIPDLPDVPLKTCKTCGQEKPETAFSFSGDKKRPKARRNTCKACCVLYSMQYNSSHYDKHRQHASTYQKRNKTKVRAYHNTYRATNRPRVLAYARKHYQQYQNDIRIKARTEYKENPTPFITRRHRYRARKHALPDSLTQTQWQFALEYWKHACAACKQPQGLWTKIAMDHWIPIKDPNCPGTTVDNMLPLCHGRMSCNTSKQGRDPQEWLLERFGQKQGQKLLKQIKAYFALVRDRH
jgi:hypothetical protein